MTIDENQRRELNHTIETDNHELGYIIARWLKHGSEVFSPDEGALVRQVIRFELDWNIAPDAGKRA
jgi:hypothetical protein